VIKLGLSFITAVTVLDDYYKALMLGGFIQDSNTTV